MQVDVAIDVEIDVNLGVGVGGVDAGVTLLLVLTRSSHSSTHQVKTTTVYVNHGAHQLSDHGTALYVPPGPARAPGGTPGGLPRLGRLPEGKV